MNRPQTSELVVVTKAKQLCGYVMTATSKSPRVFRFTFVSRLQNYSLELIECIFRANDVFIGPGSRPADHAERREFQRRGLTAAKLLAYFAMLAKDARCLLPKQYEQIAIMATDCQHLLGAWVASDTRRLSARTPGASTAKV